MSKYSELSEKIHSLKEESLIIYSKYQVVKHDLRLAVMDMDALKRETISNIQAGDKFEINTGITHRWGRKNKVGCYNFVQKSKENPFTIKITKTTPKFVVGEVNDKCDLFRGDSYYSHEIRKNGKFRVNKENFRNWLFDSSTHVKKEVERELSIQEIFE